MREYHVDLRKVTQGAEDWGCRKLHAHVRNLSRDAALWRAQEPNGSVASDTTTRTGDPDEIRAFFAEHIV